MALCSVLAQEGVSRASSYISSNLDDKASRANIIARLEMALSRLEFVLERTGKMPITYAPLLRRWKILQRAYIEGTYLLRKHKGLTRGHVKMTGQVVVRGYNSSCLRWICSAANLSISSMLRLKKEHLSSSVAQTFEWYADSADKFVADVESVCPLRCNTFRYPFVRQLFEGKTLWYQRMKGSQRFGFYMWPMILAGYGVQAYIRYGYFDQKRLDKCVTIDLALRLSESTDIVGIAISCLQSSTSLLDLVIQDATGELTLLHNLENVTSSSYISPEVCIEEWSTRHEIYRSDPLCCQPNGHDPSVDGFVPSELSHILPEQVITFGFQCFVPALERKKASSTNVSMIHGPLHLSLSVLFIPLHEFTFRPEECFIYWWVMGRKMKQAYGNIQQTMDIVRSQATDYLVRQPEATNSTVGWFSKHSSLHFRVGKECVARLASRTSRARGHPGLIPVPTVFPCTLYGNEEKISSPVQKEKRKARSDMATVPKTRNGYRTRSTEKRKRRR